MTPHIPRPELHAEQLRATLAAKLPTTVKFDKVQAAFLALLKDWQHPTDETEAAKEKAKK